MARRNRRGGVPAIYTFGFIWMFCSFLLPLYRIWGLLLTLGLSMYAAYQVGRAQAKKQAALEEKLRREAEEEAKRHPERKSYGERIDPIVEEGNRALAEMGRLYAAIPDPEVRKKINEIMRITDKIIQDAIEDPSDIPQIKKFMNYYLPTTIKLLNAYDRMGAQGIAGENLDKSMQSINEMLDTAIEAYKKRLDSLFADQMLDIETDISVMNTMLAREGLTGGEDFRETKAGSAFGGSAVQMK